MKIIGGPRASGKTYQLITLSAESGFYIVCGNRKQAAQIAQAAKERNLAIPFPLTFREFRGCEYYGRGIRGLLIDNADDLLNEIGDGLVKGMSVTYRHEID